ETYASRFDVGLPADYIIQLENDLGYDGAGNGVGGLIAGGVGSNWYWGEEFRDFYGGIRLVKEVNCLEARLVLTTEPLKLRIEDSFDFCPGNDLYTLLSGLVQLEYNDRAFPVKWSADFTPHIRVAEIDICPYLIRDG